MAHFARLDNNDIVLEVLVLNNEVIIDENGIENENLGIEFLSKLFSHNNWVQTSYSDSFRGTYAGKGLFYNRELDIFEEIE